MSKHILVETKELESLLSLVMDLSDYSFKENKTKGYAQAIIDRYNIQLSKDEETI